MKNITTISYIIFILLCGSKVFAQEESVPSKRSKTNVWLNLNSGVFAFKGAQTTSVSEVISDLTTNNFFTNSPYGNKGALLFGATLNIKHKRPNNILWGLDIGYELLRSKVLIDSIFNPNEAIGANGKNVLRFNYLNTHPYIGYRINLFILSVDLSFGLDIAYLLRAEEKTKVTDAFGRIYRSIRDHESIEVDIRPRGQIAVNFGNKSAYIGYSEGIMNYFNKAVNQSSGTFGSMVRVGLSVKLF